MAAFSLTDFLREARRRRVFRLAAIYVVGAWVALQVAALAFPAFDIPESAIRHVWIGAVSGLPIALFFGWRYDVVGGRIVRTAPSDPDADLSIGRTDLVILAVLFVVVATLAFGLFGEVSKTRVTETTPQILAEINPNSIAVLPFVNMSGDPENEYFSDGMSEELLNLLSKVPGLKVIGRSSSFVYKGKNEDLRVIGSTLGVGTLLEGSVRKSGDRVRVTAQLINAVDATHIWSETYDRTMTDIFDVQDDVAAAIIEAMQILVTENPSRGRPTDNTEAYALFLRARIAANNYDWRTGEALLIEAIGIDPKFAEAYELLAYCYWAMGGTEYDIAEAQRLTGESAAQALAIAPDRALANALYSMGDFDNYSMRRVIEALETAAQERPDDPRILDMLIYNLALAGYMHEALTVAERRVEADPLSLSANGRMPLALFGVGRVDDGFAALEFFDQLDLDTTHWFIGEVNLAYRRDKVAIGSFEVTLAQDGFTDTSWVADLVMGGRDPVDGSSYLDRRIPEIIESEQGQFSESLRHELNYWYLYFGHLDRYFELINDLEPASSKWTEVDNLITTGHAFSELGFTAHPKYEQVAEMLGLFEVWDNRGPPDFCEKRDDSWVCN